MNMPLAEANLRILVPVKRVVDFNVKVRAKLDGTGVDVAGAKMSMNPFDEIALEAAVRLKEQGKASEVVAVSVGAERAEETLRAALAVGADRAILIQTEDAVEPLGVAKLLRAIAETETPSLFIMGKQAIDDDAGQTGQMLAALLGWGQGTFAYNLDIMDDAAVVTREVDGGLQTLRLALPAVVTVDLRLNQPRYASLPNVMAAKRKPLIRLAASSLGVDLTPRLELLRHEPPPARPAGVILKSVQELVQRLRADGLV